MNDNTPAVAARGLFKHYEEGRITALDGLDLEIERGAFVAVCGPSGCGKSTLLNMMAAIDEADRGTLTVMGQELDQLSSKARDAFRRHTVGIVFQLHNLLPHLTALENVQVPLLADGVVASDRQDRAFELLKRVGLAARVRSFPNKLSGGERQRVAVARALANRPRLLLADEPTGALDSQTGLALLELLTELQANLGTTLVVVTHDPEVARRAERVIHMLDGRLVDQSPSPKP